MVASLSPSSCTLPLLLLVAHAALPLADGKGMYVARLPNGANVLGVQALGHIKTTGTGARNTFGLAFASADHQWTVELCQADSDGDGQTNGQELGDPCCTWNATSNTTVMWKVGVSHPGDETLKADATLWASVVCASANSTNTTATNTSSTANTTTNATTTNNAAGPLPSAVGMGITALLFAVSAALALA